MNAAGRYVRSWHVCDMPTSSSDVRDSNFTAIEYDHISLSPRSAPWSLCFTMSSSICSVLLDLDGTLIDSQPGILASCRAALQALGHEPDVALDITAAIGPPLEDMIRLILKPYRDDRVGEAVAAYREHYGVTGLLESKLYPGISDSLGEMRDSGLRLYLATSKRTIFARRILEHLELAKCFEAICGSEPNGELDHKPELIAHILSQNRLQPEYSVVVGDRRYDIAGAHANSIRAVGVLWGYGPRDELEAAGADLLVETPKDLARAISAVVIRPIRDLA